MKQTILLISLLVILIIGYGSIYVINEKQQAIIIQFGEVIISKAMI